MRRSEMVQGIKDYLDLTEEEIEFLPDSQTRADYILYFCEMLGMLPPTIPSKKTKKEDYSYGVGCTMRCNCEDCNPEYGVNKWEPEDE